MAGDARAPQRVEPELDGHGVRVAVVAGRFNDLITFRLLDGVQRGLAALGAPDPTVEWVPGAFEVPLAAQAFAASGRVDAVIGLGCVIRGATTHYEAVAGESAAGIMRAGLATGVPVVFGVLTTEDLDQALERSEGPGGHNVGEEAAQTAVEMARLLERIRA
ncbi:MAG: 6,7-dimethyl-8-ribityllumazine synthase [Acidimicrobiales bacterium]|nr:6,7-dimethyl-8-ribityllumazine synthase [Acidimicrobiales bacterium]